MKEAYRVPFYILGFLIRMGPMHGYQLKTYLEQDTSDFAKIKLSNLYYHLGAMREKRLINAKKAKDGNRPEKEVYSVTQSGQRKFYEYLELCLNESIEWEFSMDRALFFSTNISPNVFYKKLVEHMKNLEQNIKLLRSHRKDIQKSLPRQHQKMADLIFSHHETHYRAEKEWISNAIEVFKSAKP